MKEAHSLTHAGLSRPVVIGACLIVVAACSWTGNGLSPGYRAGMGTPGVVVREDDPLYKELVGAAGGLLSWSAAGPHMEKERKDLEEILAPEIGRNEVAVRQLTDTTLQIVTTRRSAFAKDSTRIDPELVPVLRKIARVATANGRSIITVFGDADMDTPPDQRERLAAHRGETVRAELVRMGVSPLLVSATGDPQRDYNGRIEIIIQPLVSSG
jgi:outer membrane protein OmpA-like peptidoglycan-associated protein